MTTNIHVYAKPIKHCIWKSSLGITLYKFTKPYHIKIHTTYTITKANNIS